MKKMKSKIATGLVLGAISFGMFSFTTTPINAQVTDSIVTVESNNEQEVALSFRAARNLGRFAYYAAAGVVEGVAYILFGNAEEPNVYPNTALD